MHILITGGNGFVGRRLTARLVKKKHKVTIFSNIPDKVAGADVVVGDITSKKDVAALMKTRFDAIYHLAAVLDESDPNLWRVNVDGTRNMVERSKGVKRFVMMGPIGVLGESEDPLEENAPYKPRTNYERSKVAAEGIVMDAFVKFGVPYAILRCTIIYGPNGFWRQIFDAARKGYPIIGKGTNEWHLIYVDDAVRALELAMKPAAENQVYNVAGPDPHSYEETYRVIAKVLGVKPPTKHVPVRVVRAAALAHEIKCGVLRKKPNVTKMRASIARLVGNRLISIDKITRELGFRPRYTLEKGMKKTAKEMN